MGLVQGIEQAVAKLVNKSLHSSDDNITANTIDTIMQDTWLLALAIRNNPPVTVDDALQGFIQTKSGDLYISSKPFDDPRLLPGGEGIPYTYMYHIRSVDTRQCGIRLG